MITKFVLVSLAAAILSFGESNCKPEVTPGSPGPEISGDKAFEVMISFDSLNCPSVEFFKNQVKKVYKKFAEVVDFHYVPCSTSHIVGLVLECCDGTPACQINVLHACAAHKYETEPDKLGEFFVCMMTDDQQYVKGEGCANQAKMDWEWLKNCKPGKPAGEFCDNRWKQLNYYHEAKIPGIIFNRKYDPELEQKALCDLEGTLCAELAKYNVKFKECPC